MKKLILFFILFFPIVYGNKYTNFSGEIIYYGYHYLHKWKGESKTINGFISFNEVNNEFNCDLKVPIDSFDSKNGNRDSNMLIYTNALEFPDIQFVSKHIRLNQGKATVEGVLLFGGETKKITTDVDVEIKNDISFSGMLVIKLSEFKINRPTLFFKKIDDEIKIIFSIKAKKGN